MYACYIYSRLDLKALERKKPHNKPERLELHDNKPTMGWKCLAIKECVV